MPAIKTAISIDEPLFLRVESLADEMQLSRSRLFALAMEEYIKRWEYEKIQAAIDEAYRDGPDENELAVRRAMRRKHKSGAEGQW